MEEFTAETRRRGEEQDGVGGMFAPGSTTGTPRVVTMGFFSASPRLRVKKPSKGDSCS